MGFLSKLLGNRTRRNLLKQWDTMATVGETSEIRGLSTVLNESGDRSRIHIGNFTRIVSSVITCKENARVEVGDYCVLQGSVSLSALESIKIGDYVGIASGSAITDNNTHALGIESWIRHRLRAAPGGPGYPGLGNGWELSESAPVVIENGVWIGANSRILKGVTIGEGAVVASNSVVTKSVEPYTVVAGNPARKVKELEGPDVPFDELVCRIKSE